MRIQQSFEVKRKRDQKWYI